MDPTLLALLNDKPDGHGGSAAPDTVPLNPSRLIRVLGYSVEEPEKPGTVAPNARGPVPAHLREKLVTSLARGRELLEPQWHWRAVPVRFTPQPDVLNTVDPSVTLNVGPLIRNQLRGAEALAGFVGTIGSRLETEARKLMAAGSVLDGYLLDAVGSVAAEAVADLLEEEIRAIASKIGWNITNRFSPGYCSWPTADQQSLFALLPPQPAGVTLNASSLMSPIKSISGVIGLGPSVEYRPYFCDLCTMTTCHQRLIASRQ